MYLLFALGTKIMCFQHISSALKFRVFFGVMLQSCKIYINFHLSAVVINIVFMHFTISFVMQAAHFKMSIKYVQYHNNNPGYILRKLSTCIYVYITC